MSKEALPIDIVFVDAVERLTGNATDSEKELEHE